MATDRTGSGAAAGAAIGAVGGALVAGPVGAAAGAVIGAAAGALGGAGSGGTVTSARVQAAQQAKSGRRRQTVRRVGLARAIAQGVGDRLEARGQARLADPGRRPGGTGETVARIIRRAPARADGERRIGFIRASRDSAEAANAAGSADPPQPNGPITTVVHTDLPGYMIEPGHHAPEAAQPASSPATPPAPKTPRPPATAPGASSAKTTAPGAASSAPPTGGAPTAPRRGQNGVPTMATSRVVLNLEPPTNDGELLEAATHAMGVLNGLADQFEQWADMLGSFNLPRPVLDAFAQIPDGLRTAAEGAHQGARLFEEDFEESRDVASRGLHITGQDAA